jgi:hypothetical protein
MDKVQLRDEIVSACSDPIQKRLAIIEGCDHQHRHFGQGRIKPKVATNLEAIHTWHHDIEQDHIRKTFAGLFPALLDRCSRRVAGIPGCSALPPALPDRRHYRRQSALCPVVPYCVHLRVYDGPDNSPADFSVK